MRNPTAFRRLVYTQYLICHRFYDEDQHIPVHISRLILSTSRCYEHKIESDAEKEKFELSEVQYRNTIR